MKKVIIASAAVALLLLACGGEEGVTPRVPDRVEPTSPANVLKNVAISFNQRDVNLLKAMLGPNLVFYFDPRDVGQTPPESHYVIPESWSFNDFWHAVNTIFVRAYSINLSIPTGRVGTPAENETTYRADEITIRLLVMLDAVNGFIAEEGYCDYKFERYDCAGGKKYWRLTAWWDQTSEFDDENPGIAPTSLGRILALFN